MSQSWNTVYFHPQIIDKIHRDSCPACQIAKAGMGLFVDIIREQEEQK